MARPSTNTVQAPQTSDSQERFVPVSRRRLRRSSSRVSSIGTSPDQVLPLTVTEREKVFCASIGLIYSCSASITPHSQFLPLDGGGLRWGCPFISVACPAPLSLPSPVKGGREIQRIKLRTHFLY